MAVLRLNSDYYNKDPGLQQPGSLCILRLIIA